MATFPEAVSIYSSNVAPEPPAGTPEHDVWWGNLAGWLEEIQYAAGTKLENIPTTALAKIAPTQAQVPVNPGALTSDPSTALQKLIVEDPTGEYQNKLNELGGNLEAFSKWYTDSWQTKIETTAPTANDTAALESLGLEVEGGDNVTLPFDQAFGNQVINDYVIPDLDADAARKKQAADIIAGFQPSLDANKKLISDITVQGFSPQKYLEANPSLVAYYNANKTADGNLPGTNLNNILDFATAHWNTYGKDQGWNPGTAITSALDSELGANKLAADKSLESLNKQVTTLGGNITDAESAYWNNLQGEGKGLQANLDKQVGDLKGNISDQVTGRMGNLNDALVSFKGNIADEVAAKSGALGTQVTGLKGTLADEIKSKQDALATAFNKYQGNLDTEYLSKMGYLGDEVTSLENNVGTQVGKLHANLTTELDSLRMNLDGEFAERAAALQTQVDKLLGGLNTFSVDERKDLSDLISANFNSLESDIAAKKGAIDTELATKSGALTAYDQKRREALAAESAKLTASLEPLKAARLEGADAVGAAINLAVQSAQDDIIAQMALQGYIGGSTGTDQELLRAAIAGRQGAAQAVTGAKIANAEDDVSLSRYTAGAEKDLADSMADETKGLAYYGAGANKDLTDWAAGSKHDIENRAAQGEFDIADFYNKSKLDLTGYEAGASKEAADQKAERIRLLRDYGATTTKGISDFEAGELRGIGDYKANTTKLLGDYKAGGTKAIGDFNVGSNLDLDNYAAGGFKAIGDYDVNTTKGLSDYKAGELRAVGDYGTSTGKDIADFGVDQNREVGDYGINTTKGISDKVTTGERSIFDNTANQKFTLGNYKADTTKAVEDAATNNELDFFSADLNRRLAALSLPAAAAGNELTLASMADVYGQSGLNRAFANLGQLSVPGGAPPGVVSPLWTPETAYGSGLENLGAGLVGAGLQYGNANKWKFPTYSPPVSKVNTAGPVP